MLLAALAAPMSTEQECLGCGVDFDTDDGVCPECGWDPADFAERGRYGLAKSGHGEPSDDGDDGDDADRSGSVGPPPGPGGLI
jgi:protein PhnA